MKSKRKINDFGILSLEITYFLVVFEQKSINGAARKLNFDPGNISRAIARLERNIGAKLFVRHKTGLKPTELGERFHAAVVSAQNSFAGGMTTPTSGMRRIRIGFSSAIAYAHFCERWIGPLVELSLHPEFIVSPSFELVELIKRREVDFILSHNAPKFPGLISRPVAVEGVVLASRSGRGQSTLILHPDMLGLERIVQSFSYGQRWLLRDYFLIAKSLESSERVMGLIPETLLKSHPALKPIKIFAKEGRITALTWPGSVGVELLRHL